MSSADPTLPAIKSEPSSSSFHAGLVEGPSPRLETETGALLRVRLRALVLLFLIVWGVFFLRNLLFLEKTLLTPIGLSVLVGLGALTIVLYSPLKISARILRALEVVFVVVIVADLMLITRGEILRIEEAGQLETVDALLHKATIRYVFTILLYGIFIPNTWRRAALVLAPVVLLPWLNHLVLLVQIPHIEKYIDFEDISFRVLVMSFAAAAAVYGTYVINNLRTTAFEARRLGQYQLIEKLGAGGMGEVWRAQHKMLARPAAIKLIRPGTLGARDTASAATILHRFEREAQVTATLESPHSVMLYDFGISDNGSFYYVMELLHGLDLEQIVRRYGPVTPDRAIYLLRQACESLTDAHDRDLIHRDIKPGNLFSCHFGRRYDFVKILDFGLVKTLSNEAVGGLQLTAVDSIAGTPSFMAPEQALGEPLDARTDIYALGCVAYWLVTGQLVFDSNSFSAMIIDHAKTPPSPPSERCDQKVPSDLENIILKCLEKNPMERPSSAEELQRELASCKDSNQWGPEQAAQWWQTHVNQ